MYYEEAEVKEYFRKNKKGVRTPYYQIGIKKKSKFNEAKKIALVDIEELEELLENVDVNKLAEINETLETTSQELIQLKKELNEYKATNESLTSTVEELSSDKDKLQEDLIAEKTKYENKVEELSEEKETSKKLLASITKLTSEKSELEKENVFLKSRSIFNRLINKQYERESNSNVIPEDVETNISKD